MGVSQEKIWTMPRPRRAALCALVLRALHASAFVIRPAAPSDIRCAAGLSIDTFEKLPLPLIPYPGWQKRAREDAVLQWADSRTALLAGPETHALVVAMRDQAESGRFLEGVDDSFLGFAELGLLPPPPERAEDAQAAAAEASMDEGATSTSGASVPADGAEQPAALFPYLANLAVKAGARRLGIGRELVLTIERTAAESGFDRMYIKVDRQNFEARRLYDRLGYRLVYLQPRTDPRKGPLGANLFLRKDGLLVQAADGMDAASGPEA